MNLVPPSQVQPWPLWRKIIFRFFFIYLALYMAPWTWLDSIPGMDFLTRYYYQVVDWAVNTANANFFHVRKQLVPINGSGDTSYGWAQTWLYLSLSVIGCLVWTLADRRRKDYRILNYWLCTFTRYYLALFAFLYGIIKLFALQMPFPNLSQLATPLGDFLPMRLSWMFLGYSAPYQVFSGVMEVLVGVLLLYRRTTTLGVLVATAVFTNIMMLNLSYDIPVKLFSIHLVVFSLFLLANEFDRVACFFVLNRPAAACRVYQFPFSKKWMRASRVVLKIAFILLAVAWQFYQTQGRYKRFKTMTVSEAKPIKKGLYDVTVFSINRDTIPQSSPDPLRWQDFIIDNTLGGSMKTSDTSFRHIYKRAYFAYVPDTVQHRINFKNSSFSSEIIASLAYDLPDSNTVRLWGRFKKDSLYVELKRSLRTFQLAEKQFHWLSEYNR
jgi:hypothetical protein